MKKRVVIVNFIVKIYPLNRIYSLFGITIKDTNTCVHNVINKVL